tara:strand:- start:3115 stop:5133 length:2019 start_codon:yes stop_codon:yes gene_type:complete
MARTPPQKNPANSESGLFKALTRLFSGPIVSYRSQSGRRIRRQHLDKFSSRFKSASGQQFKKTLYSPLDAVATNAIANQRRSERYVDFDQMEYMPEIASTMDIYADEMTTYSELRPMLNINCPNEEISAVLDVLFDSILNLKYNLFGWARTMCKYGDFFLYIDIDDKYGVQSVTALPTQEVERLEGKDSTNPNYVQYQWNSAGMTFENWQICHFRVLGNDKYAPYGTSILEPARRIWRQLTLMEDAMMAYRVVRSSERRVFKIDVGAIPPNEVEQYMEKVVTQLKRHQVIDPDTGRVDLRYNPMSIEEDYFIPVRAGSVTDIVSLAGAQNITQIDDIKYLRDKLFSALKIPQSYLTMGEGAEEDKSTLAQKDIRFARTIQRLQRVIIAELTKIGIIHLYTLGFRGDDLLSFTLTLNNPSRLAELQEIEFWKSKFDIAASATEGYFSRRWVTEKIFGMSHEEFIRNQREMYYDRKHDAGLQQVAEQAAAGGAGGGLGGGDLGGGLGGDLGAPPDLGAGADPLGTGGPPELPAGEAGEPPAGGDESPLLAVPPGSKNEPRLHGGPNSKSPKVYHPKKVNRHIAGRRKVSNAAQWANEKGLNTPRTTFPGMGDLSSLVKGSLGEGIYEEDVSTYKTEELVEETQLFQINESVRTLIGELEELTQDKMEQENEDKT